MKEALTIAGKIERHDRMREILVDLQEEFAEDAGPEPQVKRLFEELEREIVRGMIVEGKETDRRTEVQRSPAHLLRGGGSAPDPRIALFTRGETQVLAVTTLGTSSDEQRIDSLNGETFKSFMLHYNFPPFSVGEARMLRGPGRREIGHGALAERALLPVLPVQR